MKLCVQCCVTPLIIKYKKTSKKAKGKREKAKIFTTKGTKALL